MELLPKKILITGATGYVGRNLTQSLIKKGYEVYILTRKENSIFLHNKDVNVIIGDITSPIVLPAGIETIYHCAGVIYLKEELEHVNVLGTQYVVELALRHNCKLIHLSSAGVIGSTKNTILDETTSCYPHNDYEISKYKAEQIVISAIAKGLRVQILRPTTIFGFKTDHSKDSFFQLLKSMRTGVYKNIGQGIYNIVHIDEVVKALVLLDSPNIPSAGMYIINNTITYAAMDKIVKELSPSVKKQTQSIPYPVAYIITLTLTVLCFITNKKNPLTFSRLKALANKKVYSQKRIIETLSFENSYPIEEYIKNTCGEYLAAKTLT